MTHFSCVGLQSNEAWGLCGPMAGAQGHNMSSDLTQSTAQTLNQQQQGLFRVALQPKQTEPYKQCFISAATTTDNSIHTHFLQMITEILKYTVLP